MIEIPNPSCRDLIFGNAKYLPSPEKIPQHFWDDYKSRISGRNEFLDFAEQMFYVGIDESDLKRLIPKSGVHKEIAFNAVLSVLRAVKPSEGVKIVGAAFMLSEWFTIRQDFDI